MSLDCSPVKYLEILPCVSALGNGIGCKSIVGVYQGPSFNMPPDSSADSSVCFIIPGEWVKAQWLEMQTVVYRTQGILPLPPKVEAQHVSSSEAGLTALRSDSSGCTAWAARAVLHFTIMPGTSLLSGSVPGKRPLAILSSNLWTRSSAKLPPHIYTGQQITLTFS